MLIRRSLQRRLTVLLTMAILMSGVTSAVMSFVMAYHEAKEFQDDMLRQIGLLTAESPPGSKAEADALDTPHKIPLDDPESRIRIFRLPGDRRPEWLIEDLSSGIYTLPSHKGKIRVFVYQQSGGRMTIVTQPTDIRDEISMDSALHTLLPILLILPVMAWLIIRIVRRELKPVRSLAGYVDAQPTERPKPLPETGVPDEVVPFVQAINRLIVRVSGLMGQQRRFIADASHELRTPLTALSIQIQNLNSVKSLSEMASRIRPLKAGMERAQRLTEQLLSLARIQSEISARQMVNVSEIARQLIAEYMPVAESKRIDLGLDGAEVFQLQGEEENIRLILKNGLENAIKYTPPGGEVTIRLLHQHNKGAGFEIVDSGPGIPLDELKRVFDPFHRLPDTGEYGNGLGLTIALEAAISQGGHLDVLNRSDGQGLIFRYLRGDLLCGAKFRSYQA